MIRLLSNTAQMLVATIAAQAFTVLAVIVAARNTAPELLGPVVGFVGLVSLAASVADFGINSLTVRTLVADPSDLGAFATTLSVKVVVALALGLAWVAACVVALLLGSLPDVVIATTPLGVYLGAWVVSSTLAVPFRSAERFGPVAAGLALERAVLLGVTVALMAVAKVGAVGFGLAYMADGLAALAFFWVLSDHRHLILARPRLSTFLETWRGSVMFGLSSVASQIQKADVLVVAAASGALASGIYAVPARVTTPISMLVGSFTSAMFPMVASGTASSRRHAFVGSIGTFGAIAAGVAVLWVFAGDVVALLLGPAYLAAVPVLRIVLIATVIAAANQPMAVYLQATRRERYVATIVLLTALGGLVAVGAGAVAGGATGAAWGTVLQQAAIAMALASSLRRSGLRPGAAGESGAILDPTGPHTERARESASPKLPEQTV